MQINNMICNRKLIFHLLTMFWLALIISVLLAAKCMSILLCISIQTQVLQVIVCMSPLQHAGEDAGIFSRGGGGGGGGQG